MRLVRPGGDILSLMTMAMACDLTTLVMPLIVGAMVDQHGMTDAAVGFVATAQMMACALLSFAMAPRVNTLNPRAAITLGLILVGLGNAVTLIAHHAPLLVAGRLSAGLGEALVNVVVGVLVSRRRNPDQGFAMVSVGVTVGAVIVFILTPMFSPYIGKDGIFWILAALPALALPCVLGIPKGKLALSDRIAAAPASWSKVLNLSALAVLAGIVGFYIAGNAVFVFVERIGEGVGVGYNQMVHMLLWVTVWTAAGSVVARIIGARVGRMPILIFAFVGLAISDPMMGSPTGYWVLFMGLNLGGFCLLLGQPFYFGLLAAMDPQGRLVTLLRGVLAVAMAITPSIASVMLMTGGGFRALGYLSAALSLASLVLVYYGGRWVGRRPAAALAPEPVGGLQLE